MAGWFDIALAGHRTSSEAGTAGSSYGILSTMPKPVGFERAFTYHHWLIGES
jgi:hypothetical protein